MDKVSTQAAQEALSLLIKSQAFVADQAPDFMKQILAYFFARDAAALLCLLVLLLVAALLFKPIKRAFDDREDNGLHLIGGAYIAVVAIVTVLMAPALMLEMMQIHYAPKIFLLEYFAHLVK